MAKVVIENARAQIYVGDELTEVSMTIEIDLDRLSDLARRAYNRWSGETTWGGGAIRALIQEERSGG